MCRVLQESKETLPEALPATQPASARASEDLAETEKPLADVQSAAEEVTPVGFCASFVHAGSSSHCSLNLSARQSGQGDALPVSKSASIQEGSVALSPVGASADVRLAGKEGSETSEKVCYCCLGALLSFLEFIAA